MLQGVNLKRFRTESWLSSIKIATVIVFIITGTLVNGGLNREHKPLGLVNWTIGDAPFVGGLSGFPTVFVAAALSCENRTVLMNCIVLILQQQTVAPNRLQSRLERRRIRHAPFRGSLE
jgi:amino acid permease-like protein